jgi:hypothetical protein
MEERTMMNTKRRIVCAAIRASDGSVLLGIRHYSADMIEQINARADGEKFLHRSGDDQGFVDQFWNYWTRRQAYDIAEDQSQIWDWRARTEGTDGPLLHSECLY